VNTSEKLCRVCNNKNDVTASVCVHCGSSLDENVIITEKVSDLVNNVPVENIHSFIDAKLIPEGGIGVYVAGSFMPYYLQVDKELIIGRKVEPTSEAMLDLSEQDAFHMGVSRRHALIRRSESGFEVIDLASRNGSWLNAEKLVPERPYPFASGSQLRVGQMRLFIIYRPRSGSKIK